MNFIEHGTWVRYQTTREGYPPGVLFARRESDGVDWYEYIQNSVSPFAEGSVKIAFIQRDEGYVVGPAVYDESAIFPADHTVVEITGYAGTDPQTDFGNKVYDPAAGTFSDRPPLPDAPPTQLETKMLSVLETILARLDKLEKK